MSTTTVSPVSTQQPTDLYALDPAEAKTAPVTMKERWRFLGPGMIMSAAVIGSGELITTTTMGARVGFALLWLIVVSTLVKVWVQMELATYTILNGVPAMQAYARVPFRIGKASWINVLWILMDFAKMFQRGGIIGGTVSAFSIMLPVVGEPLGHSSLVFWTIVILVVTVTLNVLNKYKLLENVAFWMVVVFTLTTVGLAASLSATKFAFGIGDIAGGFSFDIPAGAVGIAVAVFGLTGVGADEMTTYTYWCMEKGYARWTGPDDGSEERAKRAEGWIKVMRLDILVSWVICTLCTLSFYTMGAAVLHPQGLNPSGNDVILTLSHMYSDVLGPAGYYIFLVGAIGVLWSTFIASTASVPRLWANNLATFGVFHWHNVGFRVKLIRIFTIVMPIIWASTYLGLKAPVAMVMVGGIGGAVFLAAVVVAVWYLRTTGVPKRFKSNRFLNAMLIISSTAIAALSVISLLEAFGISVA
ncbi:Nramp family divalent metal transporter [Brooklawnia cerclae]|uniref:Mn2+/Fe2+ NRAMP family transporter n=1 Tax=Brooklawnia cerclae TaxID=349934 RepID=A0ABX0SFC3_9ACTN|nr:Nramp family divalent metal transporter [Brooklawnia cerclae]NIH56003.1 Mn2+/Fe2+ NRAMP family transporter [Brooklawnia cerclae]